MNPSRAKKGSRARQDGSLGEYIGIVSKQHRYDEMFNSNGKPRWGAKELYRHAISKDTTPPRELQHRINATIEALGITFAVTGAKESIDRAWPMDHMPRVIAFFDWEKAEKGLMQRMRVLNMFIDDIYNRQMSIKDKVVPKKMILSSPHYIPKCKGVRPLHGAWVNICGTDLLRNSDGQMVVLEDNLRVPSGISYMLENREVMYRVAIELFESCNILPVEQFPRELYMTLASMSPRPGTEPTIVVHTPGIYNSAYFEHAHLASQMGVELVEAGDMVVIDDIVYLNTVEGLVRVDVIYRRVNDTFIDPEGIAQGFRAWRAWVVACLAARQGVDRKFPWNRSCRRQGHLPVCSCIDPVFP